MTSPKKAFDIVMVGNYTKDTIITPQGTRYVDGGAMNYAAHAAVHLGFKTAVVTRLAEEDRRVIDKLEAAGVSCFPEFTPSSTCVTLEYKTDNVDQRNLYVTATAGAITPRQLDAFDAQAVVIGSTLRGEVNLDVFEHLRARKFLVAADAQGFVRILNGKSIEYAPWPEMAATLSLVDIWKADAVEAKALTGESDIEKSARFFSSLGPREIVLTHQNGVLFHVDGKDIHYGFFPESMIGRSGRGDTCLGSYTAMRLKESPEVAGRWSAAVTSLKMERPVPFDRTIEETEAFISEKYSHG
jgi:sugar/nucleoside kinase (ribokinase family)